MLFAFDSQSVSLIAAPHRLTGIHALRRPLSNAIAVLESVVQAFSRASDQEDKQIVWDDKLGISIRLFVFMARQNRYSSQNTFAV